EKDRDTVFLWVGNRDDGMLGLWGPGTSYGSEDSTVRKHHVAFKVSISDLMSIVEKLRKAGIDVRGFGGETENLPSVIGWMPSAQIYLSDPDGHSLEYIALLEDTPDAHFIGTFSEWTKREQQNAPDNKARHSRTDL